MAKKILYEAHRGVKLFVHSSSVPSFLQRNTNHNTLQTARSTTFHSIEDCKFRQRLSPTSPHNFHVRVDTILLFTLSPEHLPDSPCQHNSRTHFSSISSHSSNVSIQYLHSRFYINITLYQRINPTLTRPLHLSSHHTSKSTCLPTQPRKCPRTRPSDQH